jgi:hypothetical protein
VQRFRALDDAARLCIGVGIAGALPAALTGTTDWQHTQYNARRVGLVHGLLNVAALGLYGLSWNERREGRHRRGRLLSLLGICSSLPAGTSAATSSSGIGSVSTTPTKVLRAQAVHLNTALRRTRTGQTEAGAMRRREPCSAARRG